MPELDRSGPRGQGRRTGRGLGRCNRSNMGLSEEQILKQREPVPYSGLGKGRREGCPRHQNNLPSFVIKPSE
jgi:hypothetical protein